MSRYLIVIEPTETGYSAYSTDLPGGVSTGQAGDEVERNMKDSRRLLVAHLLEYIEP